MKSKDIEINEVYAAKVSGKIAPVRIKGEGNFKPNTWYGINLATNKKVFIRSATRLRYRLVKFDGEWRKVVGTAKESREIIARTESALNKAFGPIPAFDGPEAEGKPRRRVFGGDKASQG